MNNSCQHRVGHPTHAGIQIVGGGPDPPCKNHKLYRFHKYHVILVSIGNMLLEKSPPRLENVGPPLKPRTSIVSFEINHWTSVE